MVHLELQDKEMLAEEVEVGLVVILVVVAAVLEELVVIQIQMDLVDLEVLDYNLPFLVVLYFMLVEELEHLVLVDLLLVEMVVVVHLELQEVIQLVEVVEEFILDLVDEEVLV